MELSPDLRNAIARIDRLSRPLGDNVIDLERVRFQRELRAARRRMSQAEWDDFTRGLVVELTARLRFGPEAGDPVKGDPAQGGEGQP
jgi:hypothetical protein